MQSENHRTWEELSAQVDDTCHKFGAIILRTASFSANPISTTLINTSSISRFSGLVSIVSENIKNGLLYEIGLVPAEKEEAMKLNCWILLGSLTESALQMFLSIYADDYQDSKWQQWSELNEATVKKSIFECINKLTSMGEISTKQGNSLKDAIKDTLKKHTNEHPIQRVMLDELVQFYSSMKLLDDSDIEHLKVIQRSRNGIHSFQARELGDWDDLKNELEFFCHLLNWIIDSIPDVSDL